MKDEPDLILFEAEISKIHESIIRMIREAYMQGLETGLKEGINEINKALSRHR